MILSDELNHASIIDAVRLSRPARKVIYRHSTWTSCATGSRRCEPGQRKLVITDGVFSMEGDLARLPEIVELAREHDAVVVVDDSHGTGVMGETGRGVAEHFGLLGEIDVITSHARQGARRRGGRLRGRERGGLRPARAALAAAAVLERAAADGGLLRARGGARAAPRARARRRGCAINRSYFRDRLREIGFAPLDGEAAIIPIIVGETAFAIRFSERLLEEGVFVTGFGFPVVPGGDGAHPRADVGRASRTEHLERALGGVRARRPRARPDFVNERLGDRWGTTRRYDSTRSRRSTTAACRRSRCGTTWGSRPSASTASPPTRRATA